MKKLVVYGNKQNDRLIITEKNRLDDYISSLPEGAQIELIISPVKDYRSLKLNRTYWMYLTMIGDHLGYTKHEMHDYFKSKYLCDITVVNGEETITCISTSDLPTKEFCEYLESIFQFCSINFGFVLPDIQEIREMKVNERRKK